MDGRNEVQKPTFPRSLSKSIPPSDPRYPFEQGLKTSIKLVPVAVKAYLSHEPWVCSVERIEGSGEGERSQKESGNEGNN